MTALCSPCPRLPVAFFLPVSPLPLQGTTTWTPVDLWFSTFPFCQKECLVTLLLALYHLELAPPSPALTFSICTAFLYFCCGSLTFRMLLGTESPVVVM